MAKNNKLKLFRDLKMKHFLNYTYFIDTLYQSIVHIDLLV